MNLETLLDRISQACSGPAAKDDVAAVIRNHRIQASPGYRAAAAYVFDELRRAGLEAQVESYPANYQTRFWTAGSFQEWAADSATLHLVEPAGQARKLADYRELKLSLIQRSAPFSGEVEVVLLEDGLSEAEYEGLDVAGKIVLTRDMVEPVRQLAVEQYGAAGILFDGVSSAPPVREAIDLPDVRQYTSFWWSGRPGEKQCFGFVLSPRQGAWLRQLIRQRAAAGQPPVQLRAEVKTRFYDGHIEVVTALIPGQSEDEVVLVSHLCHPQPSANDNASGVAANLEAARTLNRLITTGELPPPQRTIRFLWMPEMTGSYAYLSRHEAEIPHMVAGLNLDMVGEDQSQTGSVFLIERPPDAAASYAADLLESLRERLFNEVKTYTGLDGYSLVRYATTTFSGGSDHYIFSDPTVGVPMPMLIQWPDKFYHTSADTLDKVDPASLARAGTLAAAYAYFIAAAGRDEATWLAHEMTARFQARLAHLAQGHVTEMWAGDAPAATHDSLALAERRLAYVLERHQVALHGLARLWSEVESLAETLASEAAGSVEQQRRRLQQAAGTRLAALGADGMAEPPAEADEWEQKAATLTPRRLYRGPGSAIGSLSALSPAERADWFNVIRKRPAGGYTLPALAEYWADGRRTALQIVELIEMETGLRDAELVVRWFELLRGLKLLIFEPVTL
ncbi:MAG: M28 family metallopeptidase [Chloroflexi bacterium]|nr:M28 family metallopeptidase [Chloroflexota bacterium]MCI0576957.1 M28 family metallopeptidase [Chloroflexota bacterium]MCI0645555.1 M28 family metallopeptidase [Chloroflexota bacterium]MCI0730950.1 M28 family metallopeptidase [Chloroflexota bacterium]